MQLWWLIVLLCPLAQNKPEAVTLTAAADLAGWVASGAAKADLPTFQSGRLEDLFDGNPETCAHCGEGGLAEFTFDLPAPKPLKQIGITLSGGGVYRWQVAISTDMVAGKRVFRQLFNWRYVEGEGRDPVPIRGSGTIQSLKIIVERLTVDSDIILHEIEYYTTISLVSLRLEDWPKRPRLGTTFRFHPVALDRFGGRLPLDEGVRFRARPEELLKIDTHRVCTPLKAGKAKVRFSFKKLQSPEYMLTVSLPEPPPTALLVEPFPTSARLTFEPGPSSCRAYAVYMRRDGESLPREPQQVHGKTVCTIWDLEPETAYHFSVAGLDENGRAITERCKETRIRTLNAGKSGFCRIANIRLLVPMYTAGFQPAEIEAIINGFELAREFIFRSTRAQLNLDIHYLKLEAPVPSARDPGMETIKQDLMIRGALITDFDVLHVVAHDASKNFSGYLFSSGAVGSMGVSAQALYPGREPGVDYQACWTLIHEFQHSLDILVSGAWGTKSMLYGHFLENYPLPPGQVFDAGAFYDGQREIFRRFSKYQSLPPPCSGYLEVLDRDGDRLPDQDARLPADEARFNADPERVDSDGDGLSDPDEYCAGIYTGSDPRTPDTDGDGIEDGADPYPLSSFSGRIPRETLRRGQVPGGLLSKDVSYSSFDPPPGVTIRAAWDSDFLYLSFASEQALRIVLHIDGSGNLGPFESDRKVHDPSSRPDDATSEGSDVYSGDASLHVVFGSPLLHLGEHPVEGAEVLSTEKNGKKVIWAAIPVSLGPGTSDCHIRPDAESGPGLTLEAGRVFGFSFTVHPRNATQESSREFESSWCSVYETHRFYDAVLVDVQ